MCIAVHRLTTPTYNDQEGSWKGRGGTELEGAERGWKGQSKDGKDGAGVAGLGRAVVEEVEQ